LSLSTILFKQTISQKLERQEWQFTRSQCWTNRWLKEIGQAMN
jgi:hypothetical protein